MFKVKRGYFKGNVVLFHTGGPPAGLCRPSEVAGSQALFIVCNHHQSQLNNDFQHNLMLCLVCPTVFMENHKSS